MFTVNNRVQGRHFPPLTANIIIIVIVYNIYYTDTHTHTEQHNKNRQACSDDDDDDGSGGGAGPAGRPAGRGSELGALGEPVPLTGDVSRFRRRGSNSNGSYIHTRARARARQLLPPPPSPPCGQQTGRGQEQSVEQNNHHCRRGIGALNFYS